MERELVRPALLFAVAMLAGAPAARLIEAPGVGWVMALVVLAAVLRRPAGWLPAIAALSLLNHHWRELSPQREWASWCRGQAVDVEAELLEPWALEQDSASALLRLTPPWRSAGVEMRTVVRSVSAASDLPDGTHRLRLTGRCREGSEWANRPVVRTPPRFVVPHPQLIEVIEGERSWRGRWASLRRLVLAASPPASAPGSELARALILGERSGLAPELRLGLQRLGLAHVLAISGLHVGLVATLAALAGAALRPRRRLLVVVVAVTGYGFLAGPSPSVVRSVLMVVLGAAALAAARRPRSFDALCWATGGMTAVEPIVVTSLGFQLSVAATAGVLGLGVPWARRWVQRGGWRRWASPLAVPISAQIATLPWALSSFARVHPAAPLLDLLAVTWLGVFLVIGLVWLIGAGLPGLGSLLERGLDIVMVPLEAAIGLPPSPWLTTMAWLPLWASVSIAGLLVVAVAGRSRWRLLALAIAAMVVLLTCPRAPTQAEVVFLDVGQGDSVLVRDRGETWLIDGGGWSTPGFGSRVLLPALAGLGVRRVDGVVATHGDADHCAGLVDLLREIPVERVVVPAGSETEPCVGALASSSALESTSAGAALRVGRLVLAVLAPGRRHREPGNDASLVLRLEGLGRSFLLTGDIERRGELLLVLETEPAQLEADVLKVAHHGSHSSTTSRFLERARPGWAVVSAGRHNPFGHPASEVLERLAAAGTRVLRTDLDGRIRFRWDQGSWWIDHGAKAAATDARAGRAW